MNAILRGWVQERIERVLASTDMGSFEPFKRRYSFDLLTSKDCS